MTAEDRGKMLEEQIDSRLVDAVAACLCWAEFIRHENRTDDPLFYWVGMAPEAKLKYLRDARRVAALLVSDRLYALVPVSATQAMRKRALDAGRGLRSETGAADVFAQMIETARAELQWRSGDTPASS